MNRTNPFEHAEPLFTLGPYRALESVAATALTRVFYALDDDGQAFALHIARSELQEDPEFRRAWVDAMEQHPSNVVHGGARVSWRAHPWRDGWTVAALVRRLRSSGQQTMNPLLALTVCARVARELDLLRAAGVVHGRVGPDSVLITPEGDIVLLGHPAPLSYTSPTLLAERTPARVARMPLEQAEVRELTAATDTWQLAMLATELLIGSNPLVRRTVRKTEEALLLGVDAKHLAVLPSGMSDYLLEALATDAEDRPTTALGLTYEALGARIGGPVEAEDLAEVMAASFSSGPTLVPLRRASDRLGLESIIATLQRLDRADSRVAAPPAAPPATPVPPVTHPDPAPPPPQRTRWAEAAALVGLLGVCVAGGWWMGQARPHAPTVPLGLAAPTLTESEPEASEPPGTRPPAVVADLAEEAEAPPAAVRVTPLVVSRPTVVVERPQPAPVPLPTEEPAAVEASEVVETDGAVEAEEAVDADEPVAPAMTALTETADPPDETPAPDLWTGRWEGTSNGRPMSLDLVVLDGVASGTAYVTAGSQFINGPVTGQLANGTIELNFSSGGRAMTFSGQTAPQSMSGDVLVGGRNRGDWSLSKAN